MINVKKLFNDNRDLRTALTFADLIARTNRERAKRDDARTEEILQDAFGRPISDTARRIIELGQIRRGEIEDVRLRPPKGSLAEKILAAGRKARNEEEPI